MTVAQRQSLKLVIMIALGLAFAFSVFTVARSQSTASVRGPFMIAGGDKMMVWRIDQATGKTSYCMRDSVSTDPRFIQSRGPYCSAWSE